jgi:hypothetical protein
MSVEITFSKPQYTRVRNTVTGATEPCYRFVIHGAQELSDTVDCTLYPTHTEHLTNILRDQISYLRKLIDEFLRCNSQYFAKQYTTDAILRTLSAQVATPVSQGTGETDADASVAIFTPSEFTIHNGKIGLLWSVRYEGVRIHIPALDDEETAPAPALVPVPAPVSAPTPALAPAPTPDTHLTGMPTHEPVANQVCSAPPTVLDATELESVNDIDSDDDDSQIASEIAPDIHVPQSALSARQYDKRRLKEARLRARLAQYKVERAMTRYLEKYGDEATDSEWSDSSSSGSESDSD